MVYDFGRIKSAMIALLVDVKFALHVWNALLQLDFLGLVNHCLADLANVLARPIALQPNQCEGFYRASLKFLGQLVLIANRFVH
jgi:hypothetical protein